MSQHNKDNQYPPVYQLTVEQLEEACKPIDASIKARADELYDLLSRLVHPMADDEDVEDAKALLDKINKGL
jgi:hypothetical protein